MDTNKDPKQLVLALLKRSVCAVQVGSVLVDAWGAYAWGWNGSGLSGMGEHAEAAVIRRANRRRVSGSVLYVAACRRRNGKPVTARPCHDCQRLIREVRAVIYRDGSGEWHALHHINGRIEW